MNTMRLIGTTFCGLGMLFSAAPATADCDRSPLLVRNVSVWSPEGTQRNRDVFIAEGRIQSVTPTRGRRADAKASRTIDGSGALMLPGLIDSHIHLSINGWRAAKPQDHRWGSALYTGAQSLSAGVTNGRVHLFDMKTGPMFRAESLDDCTPLPRLQSAGPAFIPGAPTHHDSGVWSPTGVEDAIDRVRRIKAAGFEWVALHEFHTFAPEIRDAIVRTARELGLRLLGSGYNQDDVASSLATHPDTIDYIDTSPLPEYTPALIAAARAQPQLVWVARVGIHERRHRYEQDNSLAGLARNFVFIPPDEVPALRDFAVKELRDGSSDYAKRMTATYPTMRRKFRQLLDSGIPLAAGTDAGSPINHHSDAIWWELRTWVEYGATPIDALKAVTVNGAKVLARDDLGVIRPGAVGDFVLFRGDVARGDFDVAKITHVAKGGVLFVDQGKWVGPPPRD